MNRDADTYESIMVFPCFNEEKRFRADVFLQYAAEHPASLLLFVNDGSTDGTSSVLARLHHAFPTRVELLHLPTNRGKAEAVRQGFLRAFDSHPSFVGFWDADLATPLEQIDVFLRILRDQPTTAMVFGSRRREPGTAFERTFYRHAVGTCFAFLSSLLFTLPVYDTQCGAKIFRNSPGLRHAFKKPFLTKWLFDIEILARMAPESATPSASPVVQSHPLPCWKDIAGSKLELKNYLLSAVHFLKIYRAYPHLRARRIRWKSSRTNR